MDSFWSQPLEKIFQTLGSQPTGLSQSQAEKKEKGVSLKPYTPKEIDKIELFVGQFKSPITLLLLFTCLLSFFLGQTTDGMIIFAILLASGFLSFWQEKQANQATQKLLQLVQIQCRVRRDNVESEIPQEKIVPGDIVILSAGDLIPADCRLISASHLYVDQSTLTGETYPSEKQTGMVSQNVPLSQRKNSLFLGSHVISGNAEAIVVHTIENSEFGRTAAHLAHFPPITEFQKGIDRFGLFLMTVTLCLIGGIFGINIFLAKPILDSFLFSLALAVGLTPQLLPAIIAINLSRGAAKMANKKVVVKFLPAIENLGSMNILCADKTGTLTESSIQLHSFFDLEEERNEKVLRLAEINSAFETGFHDPLDEAIRNFSKMDLKDYEKIAEIPYDFVRKRISVVVEEKKSKEKILVCKGSVTHLLCLCHDWENEKGEKNDLKNVTDKVLKLNQKYNNQGIRLLAVAYKKISSSARKVNALEENQLTLVGFLAFFDPAKTSAQQTLNDLFNLGVSVKILTGDSSNVAVHLLKKLGIKNPKSLSGKEIFHMSSESLAAIAKDTDVFSDLEPQQKEQIILALKSKENVVGFLGDGINDAAALHAADVGISVDTASDIAKETAHIVLLEKDLDVLKEGIVEGRKTFANTMKYLYVATSANFGNMFSMAGTSLFLNFLPLLPKQILATNFLTDLPEMSMASDNVDKEWTNKPRKWNIKSVKNHMLVFGALSSVFDYLTFLSLLLIKAPVKEFRTAWFIESVCSAALIAMVVRSRKFFLNSHPSVPMLVTTGLVVLTTIALPLTPLSSLLGFSPLPINLILLIGGIVFLYILSAEITKKVFYRFSEE